MTPTLRGRWQTRLLLFLLFGIPGTALVILATCPIHWGLGVIFLPIALLGVFSVGFILDPVYDRVQKGRWDHDWPLSRCSQGAALLIAQLLQLLGFVLASFHHGL